MKLSFMHGRFVASFGCASDKCAVIEAGFTWDGGQYSTTSPAVAARLRSCADVTAQKQLDSQTFRELPWSGRLRWPAGLSPDPHQKKMAQFALTRSRSYLAGDPGVGKTISAALVMNALVQMIGSEEPDSIFVYVCPPFAVFNIEYELKKWTHRPVLILGTKGKTYLGAGVVPKRGVLIVPDSILHRPETEAAIGAWVIHSYKNGLRVAMIVDEAHRFKNDVTRRTKALFRQAGGFARLIFMSGSMMPNRPMELFAVVNFAAPELLGHMNKYAFGRRYCAGFRGPWGWDFTGASNIKELFTRLQPFVIRVRDDVLKLPPVVEEIVMVGRSVPKSLGALNSKLLATYSPEDLLGADYEHVATYRKELGVLTAKDALPLIRDAIEEMDKGDGLLVFCHHQGVMTVLTEGLKRYKPLVVKADLSTAKRREVELAFQEKGGVLIATIGTGGISYNLQRASRVIFVEFSWVDEDNRQAFKRAHRRGQTKSVHVQYLVYQNSIARAVMETALQKRRLNAQIR